jgi:hypothetical protein
MKRKPRKIRPITDGRYSLGCKVFRLSWPAASISCPASIVEEKRNVNGFYGSNMRKGDSDK